MTDNIGTPPPVVRVVLALSTSLAGEQLLRRAPSVGRHPPRSFVVSDDVRVRCISFSVQGPALAKVLQQLRDPTVSTIRANRQLQGLTDADVAALGAGLRDNTALKVLDLSHNQIGAAGAAALGAALRNNTALTELYLSNNRIGDAGAEALGGSARQHGRRLVLGVGTHGSCLARVWCCRRWG